MRGLLSAPRPTVIDVSRRYYHYKIMVVQNKQRCRPNIEDNTGKTSRNDQLSAQWWWYVYSVTNKLAHAAIPVTSEQQEPKSMEVFLQSLQANSGIETSLTLRTNGILPRYFQFIIRYHPDQPRQYTGVGLFSDAWNKMQASPIPIQLASSNLLLHWGL